MNHTSGKTCCVFNSSQLHTTLSVQVLKGLLYSFARPCLLLIHWTKTDWISFTYLFIFYICAWKTIKILILVVQSYPEITDVFTPPTHVKLRTKSIYF